MLEWMSQAIHAIVTFVPALFVPEGSPHFMLFRTLFGLIFIVVVVSFFAVFPFRSSITWIHERVSRLMVRHPPKSP